MEDQHPLLDQEQRLDEENQLGNGQQIDQPPPGAARDEEEQHNNQEDEVFWGEHGFGILWEVVSFCVLFYALRAELATYSWEYSVFRTLRLFLGSLIGVAYSKFGTPGLFLSKRVESNVGVLLWFFSFFVCLATDAEWNQFLNAWCPDDSLPCLPFVVFPQRIQLIFLQYGPVSMLLIPMRRIYWYCKRRGDTTTFVAQLLILLAIDMWLYVYCKYRDKMFNGGTNPFIEYNEGLPVVKYTIETLEVSIPWFLITSVKWVFIFGLVIRYMIPACLAVVDIAIRYARQNQNRARRWFLGYNPGMHLD